jgi:hypothetical protein
MQISITVKLGRETRARPDHQRNLFKPVKISSTTDATPLLRPSNERHDTVHELLGILALRLLKEEDVIIPLGHQPLTVPGLARAATAS